MTSCDPFNLRLNYAYGVIEGCVTRVVNIVRLDPSVGFLQEFSGSQNKESLAYDLQEPFRWLVNVTTIEAFESRALGLKNFYFIGDDYRYHIEIEAKRRFLELLKTRFNSGVKYKGKTWKWDVVLLKKTQELACFLLDKSKQMDFIEPDPHMQRSDTQDLRSRILELTQREAKELSIRRNTFHYLRENARDSGSVKIYQKVRAHLCDTQSHVRYVPKTRGKNGMYENQCSEANILESE